MKTATIRDLRNSFAKLSGWLEAGETVMLTKRGKPYARLSPAEEEKPKPFVKVDFRARMKADFGDLVLPDLTAALREERDDREQRILSLP